MTLSELRNFIIRTIYEVSDPDSGLELRPEIEEELQNSLVSKVRISADEAAKKLGVEW
ncbi:MAG: hypothetical protein V2I97_02245 [Desulfococcaceae bacterium]|jgi:hypothetical protein|nr:hypothetical protein [Desulfococcaceae bacterium]